MPWGGLGRWSRESLCHSLTTFPGGWERGETTSELGWWSLRNNQSHRGAGMCSEVWEHRPCAHALGVTLSASLSPPVALETHPALLPSLREGLQHLSPEH